MIYRQVFEMIDLRRTGNCLCLCTLFCTLFFLTSCGGGKDKDGSAFTPTESATNVGPIVSVDDPTRFLNIGETSTLSGTVSDEDGTIASSEWLQISGDPVVLEDATATTASFVAPNVAAATELKFSLVATDDDGLEGGRVVTVTVIPDANNRALLGPLIGAEVNASRADNPSELIQTLTTLDTNELEFGGTFSLTLTDVADDEWVLVSVTGGSDIDADDDGVLDAVPSLNAGEIRAIAKAEDWRSGDTNVTALTEIAVRRLLNNDISLESLSTISIEMRLTHSAQELLADDSDLDGVFDYRDLLAFTPDQPALLNTATLTGIDLIAISQAIENADTTQLDALVQPIVELPTFATFTTSLGDIKIELYPELVPDTVANFVTHARNGYYDGLIFHRVVADFVIQGGDPNGDGSGGASILGGAFADEFDESLSNVEGTISMANSGPNSNGSQFFFNLVDNTSLDFDKTPLSSGHAVFGAVTEGSDVLDAIASVETDDSDRPLTPVTIETVIISRE
jgi:cyclophilin family peptidyl-prolyl cis-trans isomerase